MPQALYHPSICTTSLFRQALASTLRLLPFIYLSPGIETVQASEGVLLAYQVQRTSAWPSIDTVCRFMANLRLLNR